MAESLDVVVAGCGIAGLTAALTSARLGSSTLVLTGGVPGGLLLSIDRIDGVPGFPEGVPGYELCPLIQEQAAASGAEFSMAELETLEPEADGWRLSTSEGELAARTVIGRRCRGCRRRSAILGGRPLGRRGRTRGCGCAPGRRCRWLRR
jgi:thioredoxin reductase (NADPH)